MKYRAAAIGHFLQSTPWPESQKQELAPALPLTLPPGPTRALGALLRSAVPTFILLVGKQETAILILPTRFKCVPFNTTKEQNTLHLPGVEAHEMGF